MGNIVDIQKRRALNTLLNVEKNKHYKHQSDSNKNVILANLLKEHIFDLAELCKEKEWHQTGLCLSIGAEQLDKMLDKKQTEQSITDLINFLETQEGK